MASNPAADAYHDYCEEYSYPPKTPGHLVSYAKRKGINGVKYVNAKNVISNPPAPRLSLALGDDGDDESPLTDEEYLKQALAAAENPNENNKDDIPHPVDPYDLQLANGDGVGSGVDSDENNPHNTIEFENNQSNQSKQSNNDSIDVKENENKDENDENDGEIQAAISAITTVNDDYENYTKRKSSKLVNNSDLSKWQLKQLRLCKPTPFMLRVKMIAKSEEAKKSIYECLKLMADYQLNVPFPGTIVYHFTSPNIGNLSFGNSTKNELTLEFIELYHSEKVFWLHSKTSAIGSLYIKAFQPKNWVTNDTCTISTHFIDENPNSDNENEHENENTKKDSVKKNKNKNKNSKSEIQKTVKKTSVDASGHSNDETSNTSDDNDDEKYQFKGLPESIRECMEKFHSQFASTEAGYLLHPQYKECLKQRKKQKIDTLTINENDKNKNNNNNSSNNNNNNNNSTGSICESGFMVIWEIKVPGYYYDNGDKSLMNNIFSSINNWSKIGEKYFCIVFNCHRLMSKNYPDLLELITIWPNKKLFLKFLNDKNFDNPFRKQFKPLLINNQATRKTITCKVYFEEEKLNRYIVVSSPKKRRSSSTLSLNDINSENTNDNNNNDNNNDNDNDNENKEEKGDLEPDGDNNELNSENTNEDDIEQENVGIMKQLIKLLDGVGNVKRVQTDIGYILNPYADGDYFIA